MTFARTADRPDAQSRGRKFLHGLLASAFLAFLVSGAAAGQDQPLPDVASPSVSYRYVDNPGPDVVTHVQCVSPKVSYYQVDFVIQPASLPLSDWPNMATAQTTPTYLLSSPRVLERWNPATGQYTAATDMPSGRNVYVIVHGWNISWWPFSSKEPCWMEEMAKEIQRVDSKAVILRWNWETDATAALPPSSETVNQGDLLSKQLRAMNAHKAPYMHFIGFSLGSAVSTYAVTGVVGPRYKEGLPTRLTLLDPPENLTSAILTLGPLAPNSGRVRLQSLVETLSRAGVGIDAYATQFGVQYDHGHSFNLKTVGDVRGAPGTWISDHQMAHWWFIASIAPASLTALPQTGSMARYSHYLANDPDLFWAGVSRNGFAFDAFEGSAKWLPNPGMDWAYVYNAGGKPPVYYLYEFAYLENPRAFADGTVVYFLSRYQDFINAATPISPITRTRGLPGYNPYLFNRESAKDALGFDSIYVKAIKEKLWEFDSWRAEGEAFVREGEMHLYAAPVSYIHRTLSIPPNADVMRFQYRFEEAYADDWFTVLIDDVPLYAVCPHPAFDGEPRETPWMDVSEWAGQSVEIVFMLRRDDTAPDGYEAHVALWDLDVSEEILSYWNQDPDEDGLTNYEEEYYGTDPYNADTDGDGMPDGWEVQYGLDPLNPNDAKIDMNGSGLTNIEEFQAGGNPADRGDAEEPGELWHRADVNRDGTINALDVQTVINAALGMSDSLAADINRDGTVNALDVQMVINAALGKE